MRYYERNPTAIEYRNSPSPLDEQRRIAAILDKADALRQKRKKAIELLDSLTQSIFVEMFGDPVSNPKGWPVARFWRFRDVSHKRITRMGRMIIRRKVARLSESKFETWRLSLDDIVYFDAPKNAESVRTTVQSGDILISITADLGRIAVVPDCLDRQAHINQHIALLRTKGINTRYLATYLSGLGGGIQFADSQSTRGQGWTEF